MKAYKKKKEELILLKEINSLLINAKETENEYFINENKASKNNTEEDAKNYLRENKKILEKEKKSLKFILDNLEKNYRFNSTYNEEFENNIISKKIENLTEESSKKIIELYSMKKFNLCYNLWKKFDFNLLLGISEERNFDMLNYLNKLRDRYEERVDLIREIKLIKNAENINNNSNDINQQNSNYNSRRPLQNIADNQKFGQISFNNLYNLKLSENTKLLEKLKNQVNYMKINVEKKYPIIFRTYI